MHTVVTDLCEYLSEINFVFEMNLGSEVGDQVVSFEKKTRSKISCLGTFKEIIPIKMQLNFQIFRYGKTCTIYK